MTIVFGTETVPTFDRLEAMSNRTVGVAKLCRHGLTGKECLTRAGADEVLTASA